VAVVILASPTPATGHASLVRAEPPANVILETPPTSLRLRYDEEVAPGLSLVSILDRTNLVVMQGGVVDARDPKVMQLPVQSLRPGIYTVSWKVLSAVDGHITRGAFAFTFLPPGTDPATLLESGKGGAVRQGWSRTLLTQGQVLAGWIHLVALFIAVGGLHFTLVVLAPGRHTARELLAVRERLLDPAAALATKAFAVAAITGVAGWEIHTHLTAETSLAHFMFRPALLPYLLGSRTSQSMGVRLGMLVTALAFLRVARKTSPASRFLLGYCEAVGAAALVSIALSSHSAAAWRSPLAVLFDSLHLWAGALWVGGLGILATPLPDSTAQMKSEAGPSVLLLAMRRFTPWAAGSVAVLVLTGAFQVYLHIPRPQAMVQTTYGRALTLKLLLVLPMLLLGAVNSLIARGQAIGNAPKAGPVGRLWEAAARIQKNGAGRLRSRGWTLRGEAALGVGVLLCVAALIQLPPPKAASSAPPPTTLKARASDLAVELTIASPEGLLAPSDLRVRIRRADGRPVEGIARVTLRPSMPGMEMNIAPIPATPGGEGEYRARTLFSMLGAWQVAVVIRRTGVEEDAALRFPYVVADVAAGQREVGPSLPERLSVRAAWSAPSALAKFWGGASLIALGLAIACGLGGGGLAWRRRRVWLCLGGLPLLLGGGHQMVSAMVVDTTPTAWQENPIPADPASLARGRALYLGNCVVCHGETGRGDAPLAGKRIPMVPRPADLTADHMEAHSDGDLFWWISKGIRDRAMPGFEDLLGAEDRWHLVNYIRSLRVRKAANP